VPRVEGCNLSSNKIFFSVQMACYPFVLLPASTNSIQSQHHAVVIIKATRSSERTNLPAFLTLFNIAVSIALFNYGKLHTMVEFCRVLQMVYSN
jgi:hypothetical protein